MRELLSAEIVAVGSELLTPFRTDTNSLFLTSRLNDHGIDVRAKVIVGDDRAELVRCLRDALDRADVVIVTGGLGPTEDDLTREAVSDVTGAALVDDERILQAIAERFRKRGHADAREQPASGPGAARRGDAAQSQRQCARPLDRPWRPRPGPAPRAAAGDAAPVRGARLRRAWARGPGRDNCGAAW